MRFALIATSAAAVIAIPLAAVATAPQMSSGEFVSAVRCAAYEDVTQPGADLAAAKFRLNGEARRQSAETAALAHNEASTIARQAASMENTKGLRAQACEGGTSAALALVNRDA